MQYSQELFTFYCGQLSQFLKEDLLQSNAEKLNADRQRKVKDRVMP